MTSADRRTELARAGIDAYVAGDLESVLAMMSPDVVVVSGGGMPEAGTYNGHDEFLPWTRRWLDAWEEFEMQVVSIESLGDRHVVAAVRQRGRGVSSGIDVEMDTGHVYEFNGEMLVYFGLYPSYDEALADARAREQDAPIRLPRRAGED